VGFYHFLECFKALAAIRLFAAGTGFVDFADAAAVAFFRHVRFGFFVAKGVAKTQDHLFSPLVGVDS
jgi:hypothetical protein